MADTFRSLMFLATVAIPTIHVSAAPFTAGDVFFASNITTPSNLVNVTGGGDFSGTTPFAVLPSRVPGQIAWSHDLNTAYITQFSTGSVVAVDGDGNVNIFATGLSGPTGILVDTLGRILVTEFSSGQITDITVGGDFSGAAAFASGLSGGRNLLELATGEILVAEQSSGEVTDISGGGNLAGAAAFASGLGANVDLVQDSAGRIFAAQYSQSQVMEITGGGNFSGATPFATGHSFIGLAIDGAGRLLAAPLGDDPGTVYNITAGGSFSAASPFAFNIPVRGESALDTVPFSSLTAPVPEPSTLALAVLGCVAFGVRATRRRRSTC